MPSMECVWIADLLFPVVCGLGLAPASVSGSDTPIIAGAFQSLSAESLFVT